LIPSVGTAHANSNRFVLYLFFTIRRSFFLLKQARQANAKFRNWILSDMLDTIFILKRCITFHALRREALEKYILWNSGTKKSWTNHSKHIIKIVTTSPKQSQRQRSSKFGRRSPMLKTMAAGANRLHSSRCAFCLLLLLKSQCISNPLRTLLRMALAQVLLFSSWYVDSGDRVDEE